MAKKNKGELTHKTLEGPEKDIYKDCLRTRRDEFAQGAMIGILSNPNARNPNPPTVAEDAFIIADAMLKERKT